MEDIAMAISFERRTVATPPRSAPVGVLDYLQAWRRGRHNEQLRRQLQMVVTRGRLPGVLLVDDDRVRGLLKPYIPSDDGIWPVVSEGVLTPMDGSQIAKIGEYRIMSGNHR